MSTELLRPTATVQVTCPLLDIPMQVHVARDETGQAHICGCSRYWGELLCDGACEDRAVATFLALHASKAVSPTEMVYCGHPNVAAPRTREEPPSAA